MHIILWRHAQAQDSVPDIERALTSKGRVQAAAMAAWLVPRLPQGARVWASPARRARETAQALGLPFGTLEALAPGGDAQDALDAVRDAGEPGQAAAILVGHQPMLGRIAARLLAGRESDWHVAKAGVWWFEDRGDGFELRAVLSPGLLPRA